jgi:quinol monooxygenase YgiN
MLVIAGTIPFDPAHRDAFLAACIALQEATRKEEGCLLYAFSADLEDPGLVHIVEKWTSEEALTAHFAEPHMKAFADAMSEARRGNSTVVKFQVSSEGPVR